MQYVRSITGSVSKGWNSINPATLSGAIDVIVVEQEDGSLASSPFHVRFGKFSLLRPYEKKVEFKVNGQKLDFPMKLGEGGEAFFVFETQESVPEALQTSPPVSPVASPQLKASPPSTPALQEPDPFELSSRDEPPPNELKPMPRRGHSRSTTAGVGVPIPSLQRKANSDLGQLTPLSGSPPNEPPKRPMSGDFGGVSDQPLPKLDRMSSDSAIPVARAAIDKSRDTSEVIIPASSERGLSSLRNELGDEDIAVSADKGEDMKARALNLSKKLWTSNIANQVTETGDLMLDMTAFKSGNMEALQAEGIARQLLSEEIDGPYDIGALIGADEQGNIWIYHSEEAKDAANQRAIGMSSYNPTAYASTDAISDPGYHSDEGRASDKADYAGAHTRRDSDSAVSLPSQPSSPAVAGDPNKNYAKTLRLTSEQLKSMELKPGANSMAFTVNRATCQANLWYWRHDVPIVISDIDGTITKSDVLGHVLNTIGRDWTHQGVAKLYTEIGSNGYNFLYLTSRSVGQADTTRAYLKGVVQEGFKLPPGPVILSPDRTIAALRREVYLRKPEIFKMACLRDIMALFSGHGGTHHLHESQEAGLRAQPGSEMPGGLGSNRGRSGSPFYAGFGNRLTDALSYRSVNIPSTRIFTINSNSEISLDLLSLNKYKTAYSSMREIVDHYFPPVGLLVKGGGEEFTDFNYWRERPLDIVDFTDSEDGDSVIDDALQNLGMVETHESILSEDEAGDMADSYLTDPRTSLEQSIYESTVDDEELESSVLDEEADGDDEYDDEDDMPEDEFEIGGPAQDATPPRTPEQAQLEPDPGRTPRYEVGTGDDADKPTRFVDGPTGLGLSSLDEKTAKK